MTIRYLDENGKLVTIMSVAWLSVTSDAIYNYIVYYTTDDVRHELDLPVTVPYFIDSFQS